MTLVLHEGVSQFVDKITLNDPENLNAMSEDMATAFRECVGAIKARPTKPRVIVLTGSGRAFSAGGDLSMLEKKQKIAPAENHRLMISFYESFLSILSLEIPIIAAINGPAIGAGLCVATACDIRIAATGSKLGFTFTRLGLHPGMGATYFLPRVLGDARARELLLTARVIGADEAERIGLVSRVVAGADLQSTALAIADEILASGPQAVAQLLLTLRGEGSALAAALEREAVCQSVNYASDEFKEGVRAMIEKRKAAFG